MADPAQFYIVFDGPPNHEAGRFVEVEDEQGRGLKAGTWTERRHGGYWQLGPFVEASVVGGLVKALGDAATFLERHAEGGEHPEHPEEQAGLRMFAQSLRAVLIGVSA
jgi:hypothetical protein